jgi:hypothetical protein
MWLDKGNVVVGEKWRSALENITECWGDVVGPEYLNYSEKSRQVQL